MRIIPGVDWQSNKQNLHCDLHLEPALNSPPRCSSDIYILSLSIPEQSKKNNLLESDNNDNNFKDEKEEDQPSKEELEAMKDMMFTAFARTQALLGDLTMKEDGTQKEERGMMKIL